MPARRRSFILPLVLVLAGGLFMAACGQSDEPDEQAYCRALAADPGFDNVGFINGDKVVLAQAKQTYGYLRDLAPVELQADWDLIQQIIDQRLQAAGRHAPLDQSHYPDLSAAFAAIDADRLKRCGE
ncbi:MAG: hypothetical protein FWG16_05950 [Micrococcales bacterium]|nr:hypothetical protein [Micrococcales bacterium]